MNQRDPRTSFGLGLSGLCGGGLGGGEFLDLAPEVAAVGVGAVGLPGAGVLVAGDDDAGGVGAEAGEAEVGDADDGRVAGPLDGDDHGEGDVLAAELDAGGEEPV